MGSNSEYDKFDQTIRKLLTVSHDEIQKRDKEWKQQRASKKKAQKRQEKS